MLYLNAMVEYFGEAIEKYKYQPKKISKFEDAGVFR